MERGVGWGDKGHLVPGSDHLRVTAGSCHTCDPHGCCTLNELPVAHRVRSDRVLVWGLTVGVLGAWVEVLRGWGVAWEGEGGGG